jgi:hypothetical protein
MQLSFAGIGIPSSARYLRCIGGAQRAFMKRCEDRFVRDLVSAHVHQVCLPTVGTLGSLKMQQKTQIPGRSDDCPSPSSDKSIALLEFSEDSFLF